MEVYTSTIPALRRQRWEDHDFKADLGYIVRSLSRKRTEKASILSLFQRLGVQYRGSSRVGVWHGLSLGSQVAEKSLWAYIPSAV